MAEVRLRHVFKAYGSLLIVKGINLDVEDGSFVVLLGPSGCGKSTTLRMIAGLETISQGEISIGGTVINDVPARARGVAMVFQHYALYPHMTVRQNLGFALRIAGCRREEIERRIRRASDTLELEPYLDRKPAQLSGGQRQRVAMGRAIVREPKVFLFDEPLSNLDAKLRNQMRVEIKRLHQRLRNTVVYVTHDQVEAMTMADKIVIMRDGMIEQEGAPLEVFEAPVNQFVAGFIGAPQMTFFAGVVHANGGGSGGEGDNGRRVRLREGLDLDLAAGRFGRVEDGRPVVVGLRPEDIVPTGHGVMPRRGRTFTAPVTLTESLGNETLLFCDLNGTEFRSRMQQPRPVADGEPLQFTVNLDRLHLFEPDTGRSLRER